MGLANDGIILVGVAVGWLVTYSYSTLHHNTPSLNAVYAYTMIYNVRLDVEGLSGPTFLLMLKEAELLNPSQETVSDSEPNLAYKSSSWIVLERPAVWQVTILDGGTAM